MGCQLSLDQIDHLRVSAMHCHRYTQTMHDDYKKQMDVAVVYSAEQLYVSGFEPDKSKQLFIKLLRNGFTIGIKMTSSMQHQTLHALYANFVNDTDLIKEVGVCGLEFSCVAVQKFINGCNKRQRKFLSFVAVVLNMYNLVGTKKQFVDLIYTVGVYITPLGLCVNRWIMAREDFEYIQNVVNS